MRIGLELDTRSKLLSAAVNVFGERGFDAASVREIAEMAGVNHGSIKYHYSSKKDLWRAVVMYLFNMMDDAVHTNSHLWPEMTARERIIDTTLAYVRFNAQYPQFEQIIESETAQINERTEWLNESFVRPFTDRAVISIALGQEHGVYPKNIPPMNLYFMIRAATRSVFASSYTIERNFGVDVFDDAEVERHSRAMIELFLLPETEVEPSGQPV
ncbi:MAG: TetR family transcriptional regulator [Erythrobacter sp.]